LSPRSSSAGSARSQCFSFLATKDHFSSNWTSRVLGGKGHEAVVEVLGVFAGPQAVADDGVLIDADEAAGLADAAALGEVVQDGDGLVLAQARAEQGGAFPLGEACLTSTAGEHAALFAGAVAEADAEVVAAALAEVGAGGVVAAEAAEVVHEAPAVEFDPTLDGSPESG
jgi:hypothetical protein